jgi:hypothetical protein
MDFYKLFARIIFMQTNRIQNNTNVQAVIFRSSYFVGVIKSYPPTTLKKSKVQDRIETIVLLFATPFRQSYYSHMAPQTDHFIS